MDTKISFFENEKLDIEFEITPVDINGVYWEALNIHPIREGACSAGSCLSQLTPRPIVC